VFDGTALLQQVFLATLVTAVLKVKTGTGASVIVWRRDLESMKAIIYAALCYRSRQVVIGPRQRRPCGMTEASLPWPDVSLDYSMSTCTRTKHSIQMSRACEVIASVMTYLPSHIHVRFLRLFLLELYLVTYPLHTTSIMHLIV
jgi:hypothetical protein